MPNPQPHQITISLPNGKTVSGLLLVPAAVRAGYVLAHGAGAGMSHPFMTATAEQLADRGVATLRYQFPYMEQGSRRPDAAGDCPCHGSRGRRRGRQHGCRVCRSSPGEIVRRPHDLAGAGRGAAARRSQGWCSSASRCIPRSGRRSIARSISRTSGSRCCSCKARATLSPSHDLVAQVVAGLGSRATLTTIPDADHSFHVPARTGRTDAQVLAEVCDAIAAWMVGR